VKEISQWMDTFEQDLSRRDISAMVYSNSQFHLRIARASGNKYFADCYRRILADHERIAQIWYSCNVQQEQDAASALIVTQHRALCEAVKDKDAVRAEEISKNHASLCKDGVRNTLVAGEELIADIEVEPNPLGLTATG